LRSALSGVVFCLDFDPFFFLLLFLCGVFFFYFSIYLFIYLGVRAKKLGPTLSIFELQIGHPNFMVSFFSALGPIHGHKVQHLLVLRAD
jgi:hypothetical protein